MKLDIAFTEYGKPNGTVAELCDDATSSEVERPCRPNPQCCPNDNIRGEVSDI